MLWVLLGLLLLAPGLGCVDFEQEGVGFCEKRPGQCVPSIEDVVQESAQPSGHISFRVTAKDGAAERLAFKWEASIGTLETVRTTSTSSVVLWKSPACLPMIQPGTVSVSVENSHGEVSKEFKVSVAACPKPTPTFPLTPTPSISSLGHHSLALSSIGLILRAWGANESGQLGDGTVQGRTSPWMLSIPGKVAAISSGYGHSLALRDDGTVWAWGSNDYGQLGLGGGGAQTMPVQIPALGEIVSLSAGASHSLALGQNGTVWAWGSNDYGQLGDGALTIRQSPMVVNLRNNVSGIASLAAGWSYSMALCYNGDVWVWGYDFSRMSPTPSGSHFPDKVYGLPGIVAIAAGRRHALALSFDGTVWAWGNNDSGQLGLGGHGFQSSPKRIPGLSKIRAIAAGSDFSIALGSQGEVWAWGLNVSGQMGDGTTSPRDVPAKVPGLAPVSFVAAGERHVSAMNSNGVFWTWGDDGVGGVRLSPERVSIP
ncbi:chromosome condensation regulator [Cystobacter fuscus]|uniref:Chromosome condensation regulator n=2 Tax=Cystobacter fuscus TaxID=43 RepID=A0A250IT73_9BACT|nr:chromosome condensation regulator [Cystobacter fuscus]